MTGIRQADKVVITIITDNYYDALRPDTAIARRFRAGPGRLIHGEHGFSCFVETWLDGKPSSLMFDYGLDPKGVAGNMETLDIDIARAEAFGLSHGHFDHSGALVDILTMNRAKIRKGSPLYLGEEAFNKRYALMPGSTDKTDIGRVIREDVEALDLVEIVEVISPKEVMPGGWFTGSIERVTAYESVSPMLLVEREDGIAIDTFPGEQAMVFNVRGNGLVVLSGCAHSGIINTVRHARKMSGTEKVHAVIGGFHLVNASPEVLRSTMEDMRAIDPDYIVPAHCTGFEATTLFAREMQGAFILNTAGTTYTFAAEG